jgi:NADH-quinone oxidoreductase subunit A
MIEYVGVLFFLIVGALFVSLTLVATSLVRPSKITREKIMPYECGENPIGTPWGVRFNIRFYVFALVFLVFDVEAVMLIPWAVAFKSTGMIAFVAGMIFIGMLVLGLADVWRKGDLVWVREEDREAARAGARSSSSATKAA